VSDPVFTISEGRAIFRDGKPFAHIERSVHPITGNGPMPADVDNFARLCALAPSIFRDAIRVCEDRARRYRRGAGAVDTIDALYDARRDEAEECAKAIRALLTAPLAEGKGASS